MATRLTRDATRQLTTLIVIINAGSPFWVVKPSSNYTSIFVVAKSEIKYTNYDAGCFLFPLPNPPYHF